MPDQVRFTPEEMKEVYPHLTMDDVRKLHPDDQKLYNSIFTKQNPIGPGGASEPLPDTDQRKWEDVPQHLRDHPIGAAVGLGPVAATAGMAAPGLMRATGTGELAEFGKLVAKMKILQTLGLPEWMALSLGGGGKIGKVLGGGAAAAEEEGAALGGSSPRPAPLPGGGTRILPQTDTEIRAASGAGAGRFGVRRGEVDGSLKSPARAILGGDTTPVEGGLKISRPALPSPDRPSVTTMSTPSSGKSGLGSRPDPEMESILDATKSARPNPLGHGTFRPSLGAEDTAGLRRQPNVGLKRSVGDVREQVGRGVSAKPDPSGSIPFEQSEKDIKGFQDQVNQPIDIKQQLKDSLDVRRKKKGS